MHHAICTTNVNMRALTCIIAYDLGRVGVVVVERHLSSAYFFIAHYYTTVCARLEWLVD